MLDTSKDLLNIVLAFCILWFTIFVCWVIYYFAMILKRIYKVTEVFTKTIEAVGDFFSKAKEKLEKTTSSFSMLLDLAKKIYDTVSKKKQARASRKKAEAKVDETE